MLFLTEKMEKKLLEQSQLNQPDEEKK